MAPSFEIASENYYSSVTLKGNVRIEHAAKNGYGWNSVVSDNNKQGRADVVDAKGEKMPALYVEDDCYNVFMAIVGTDEVLEEKDLSNIDAVAKKYKGKVQIDKSKLNEGELSLNFKNGYKMTIDFETEAERKEYEQFIENTTDPITKFTKKALKVVNNVVEAFKSWLGS